MCCNRPAINLFIHHDHELSLTTTMCFSCLNNYNSKTKTIHNLFATTTSFPNLNHTFVMISIGCKKDIDGNLGFCRIVRYQRSCLAVGLGSDNNNKLHIVFYSTQLLKGALKSWLYWSGASHFALI